MGVLPLQFAEENQKSKLQLTGDEAFNILGLSDMSARQELDIEMTRKDGSSQSFKVLSRLDTLDDVNNYRHGGILQATLRELI